MMNSTRPSFLSRRLIAFLSASSGSWQSNKNPNNPVNPV
jgi:hypothetical protein